MNEFWYIISGIWFATIAKVKQLWYNEHYDETWDYTELNRESPICYFYTGKRE